MKIPARNALIAFSILFALAGTASWASSPIRYEVSLDGRDHHEMRVEVTFSDLDRTPLEVRMSRTSPGRYALHEFSKNVYDVTAVDGRGNALDIVRPDLHQWTVSGHDGTVVFSYTLFGDRSDGTYAAIDASHAHLNVPASFVWARGLEDRPIEVRFDAPEDWKVHTQMPAGEDGAVTAPDLAFFIDSPIEVSPAETYSWTIGEGDNEQTIEVVLHHVGEEPEAKALVDVTKLIVDEQVAIFGEAPDFDYGRYTFLVDALPWSNGDGMEHRDSTIVATSGHVKDRIGGLLGTISHEFFHAWNVERIRPSSLEPFDLEDANVSRELWFAEGFTSYYGNLVMARIGAEELEDFAGTLGYYVNSVLNSPGVTRRSVAEMSTRAPFVDAANSNDPTNRANTFLSYYTYGAALGLGLDLVLRNHTDLTLDDVMQAAWERFGKNEVSYDNEALRQLVADVVADSELSDGFFGNSVTGREPPDFESLLAGVGLRLRPRNGQEAWLGDARLEFEEADADRGTEAGARVRGSVRQATPLHLAGVGRNDLLISLGGEPLSSQDALDELLDGMKPGDSPQLVFEKRGEERTVDITLGSDNRLEVVTFEAAGEELSDQVRARRDAWLAPLATPRLQVHRYCSKTGQPYPYSYWHCPVHGDELQLGPKLAGE